MENISPEQEFVMGYREAQERARAGAQVMGTEIEGRGALARAQERLEKRTGSAADRKLLIFFRQVAEMYKRFAPDDEVLMMDEFHRLPNYKYKNPYAFLLAYIATRERPLTREMLYTLYGYARASDVGNLSPEDIIRYYRLIQGIKGVE